MSLATINFSVRNNVDWARDFNLLRGNGSAVPWANVTPYTNGAVYSDAAPTSVVVQAGDLYVAKPGLGTITAGTFDPTQWVLAASGAAYGSTPYDLTGASLEMGLAPQSDDGSLDATQGFTLSTMAGTLVITNAANGAFSLALPAIRARAFKAGTYAYDLVLIRNLGLTSETRRPVLVGTIDVVQGVVR